MKIQLPKRVSDYFVVVGLPGLGFESVQPLQATGMCRCQRSIDSTIYMVIDVVSICDAPLFDSNGKIFLFEAATVMT